MKTVVVLGALGMAGHMVVSHLRSTGAYKVLGVARNEGIFVDEVLDVTHFEALALYLEQIQADYIINCVGALVEQAKQQTALAILLNTYLPHFLAETGENLGFKLIHISTDCVFSGKDGGYIETSFRDGNDVYARSKALGEVINNKDLTIRTSIVGPELKQNGTSLFDFFLKQEGMIKGYSKAFWSGVTTLALAQSLPEFMDKNICGLYHLTNGEPISKYDLLKLFNEYTDKDLVISELDAYVTDKSLQDTRGLISPVPEYHAMIADMVCFMQKNKGLYPHYNI